MFGVMDMIVSLIACAILGVTTWILFEKYCSLRKVMEEQDDFERLMRRQLELDAARLKAQEDLLREACRSWAEDAEEEDE